MHTYEILWGLCGAYLEFRVFSVYSYNLLAIVTPLPIKVRHKLTSNFKMMDHTEEI